LFNRRYIIKMRTHLILFILIGMTVLGGCWQLWFTMIAVQLEESTMGQSSNILTSLLMNGICGLLTTVTRILRVRSLHTIQLHPNLLAVIQLVKLTTTISIVAVLRRKNIMKDAFQFSQALIHPSSHATFI
jgi:hypothetical protein